MTECAPGCGRCCDPVVLDFPADSMTGPSAAFAREHWTEYGTEPYVAIDGEPRDLHLVRCDAFDRHTRLCTAGEARPPICSGFPYYDHGPEGVRDLRTIAPGCAYTADHYRLLPIVEVS